MVFEALDAWAVGILCGGHGGPLDELESKLLNGGYIGHCDGEYSRVS